MSILHSLAAFTRGHLSGIQATQRDWSPFLAHFTTWSAMRDLRCAVKDGKEPRAITEMLEAADKASLETSLHILQSRSLRARSPSDKDGLPGCVCMSECSLPGLISHCERYGRFGFVFAKEAIFGAGGRPCIYLGREEYAFVAENGRGKPADTPTGRLFALANLYEPRRTKVKLQDYTHEREWRLFRDLSFDEVKLEAVLAPSQYAAALSPLCGPVPFVPVDMLFEWGA